MQQSTLSSIYQKNKLQLILVAVSFIAIVLFIIFQITALAPPNLPLWMAIILAGIPSIFYIFKKLLKGEIGADLLAAIAIITAVVMK